MADTLSTSPAWPWTWPSFIAAVGLIVALCILAWHIGSKPDEAQPPTDEGPQ